MNVFLKSGRLDGECQRLALRGKVAPPRLGQEFWDCAGSPDSWLGRMISGFSLHAPVR